MRDGNWWKIGLSVNSGPTDSEDFIHNIVCVNIFALWSLYGNPGKKNTVFIRMYRMHDVELHLEWGMDIPDTSWYIYRYKMKMEPILRWWRMATDKSCMKLYPFSGFHALSWHGPCVVPGRKRKSLGLPSVDHALDHWRAGGKQTWRSVVAKTWWQPRCNH